MLINIIDDHKNLNTSCILIGEPIFYFDGNKILDDEQQIIKLLLRDPSLVKYVLSDVDLIIKNTESIDIYSSSQSSGVFYRFNNGVLRISKDERNLLEKTDNIPKVNFTHQIMFRKFDESILCPNIKRNSPLLISKIYSENEHLVILNIDFQTSHMDFTQYYDTLNRLCSVFTSSKPCATLFSGGIDSALMSIGVTEQSELVHYCYKDFSTLEQSLAKKVASALKRDLNLVKVEDEFSVEKFSEYSRHILPCCVDYKIKFNWSDYSEKPYLLTGQNADSFIYGDSFNKSNLRGFPGRMIINLITLKDRFKYFCFSYIKVNRENALKLYYYGNMDAESEHTTFNFTDFLAITKFQNVGEDTFSRAIRGIKPKKLTVLQWIKIFKIFRILHNVNYNGRAMSSYTGVIRINPYSNAYMIEQALNLKYGFFTIFIPKFPSFNVFKKMTGVSFFKLLSSCEPWYSSLKKRSRKDAEVAGQNINLIARANCAEGGSKLDLMEINFKNWLER